MQILYIAEKPDIANAIAGYLWPEGGFRKAAGWYRKGDVTVSWAVGHLLELATPEVYDKRYARWNHYRIFPKVWQYTVIPRSAQQFRVIEELLKSTDVVIHANELFPQLKITKNTKTCTRQALPGKKRTGW